MQAAVRTTFFGYAGHTELARFVQLGMTPMQAIVAGHQPARGTTRPERYGHDRRRKVRRLCNSRRQTHWKTSATLGPSLGSTFRALRLTATDCDAALPRGAEPRLQLLKNGNMMMGRQQDVRASEAGHSVNLLVVRAQNIGVNMRNCILFVVISTFMVTTISQAQSIHPQLDNDADTIATDSGDLVIHPVLHGSLADGVERGDYFH